MSARSTLYGPSNMQTASHTLTRWGQTVAAQIPGVSAALLHPVRPGVTRPAGGSTASPWAAAAACGAQAVACRVSFTSGAGRLAAARRGSYKATTGAPQLNATHVYTPVEGAHGG